MKKHNQSNYRIIFLFLGLLLRLEGFGQFFTFSPFKTLGVEQNENLLPNPWTGSYNSGQFWPCDLNNDGDDDLIVFDKTSNRVLTYLREFENGRYLWKYNSDFEDLIPEMESWMATADFNCDGKLDLFTQTSAGIKVFKNVTSAPGQVAFSLEVDGLTSIGFNGPINLQVNPYGAPAITDVDNDGDLDVLTFDFSGNTVEYHKNQVFENSGQCAGFQLKKDSCVFGLFATKPICGQIRLNTGCFGQRPGPGNPMDPTSRIQHIGSQLSAIDLDADGDKDLLVGDIGCSLLNKLTNGGTASSAIITAADTLFPSASSYVKIPFFPSAYQMDFNFDNKTDLAISPTFFSNYSEDFKVNTSKGTYLYLNQSQNQVPDFQLAERDFLQNQSIEVGEESVPAFADIDGDGDKDLFVGNLGQKNGSLVQAKVAFYKNIGTSLLPKFSLETDDYLGLSSLFRKRLRPVFEDFNGDGATDFGWISSPGNTIDSTFLYVLINQNPLGQPFSFSTLNQAILFPFTFSIYDCPTFVDIDGDNQKDMLVGKYTGRIQYWRQTNPWPVLQYQLVNNNYGNINRAPFSNNPNLSVTDIDQDGNPDLAVGDLTGKVKFYRNFKLSPTNTFLADSSWYQNLLLNQKLFRKFGNSISPALSDLNGDGFPELAIGTQGGGVVLLVNRLGTNSVDKLSKNIPWKIFPNPSQSGEIINWYGMGLEKIEMTSILGTPIQTWNVGHTQNTGRITLPNCPSGIYVFVLSNSSDKRVLKVKVN